MRTAFIIAAACLLLLSLWLVMGCSSSNEEGYSQYGVYGGVVIGPADSYDVFAYGGGGGYYGGGGYHGEHEEHGYGGERGYGGRGGYSGRRADTVEIIGHGVRPAAGPVLAEFALSVKNVDYQPKPFHVISIGSCSFSARMTTDKINAYLNARAHSGKVDVREIRMTFLPQQAQVTATVLLNNRALTVMSMGTLKPEGTTRIVYVPSTMFTVEKVALPADVRQDIMHQINPIVDLSSLHSTPKIEGITLAKDSVILTGTATLKHLP